MSRSVAAPLDVPAPSNEHLLMELSRPIDRRRRGRLTRIVGMERTPFAYGSSWWLEEITLHFDDHSHITLIFKDLVREAKGSGAHRIKPAFVTNPAREPWVYRTVLPEATPGSPKLWAAVTDVVDGRHWLFLERVNGEPLAQVGDRDAWCAAARWLGEFHSTAPVAHAVRSPLLRHDQEYHWRWLARALSTAQGDKLSRLRALAPVHDRAIEEALRMRVSLIHGEFYASNVLVQRSGSTYAIHPLDWEMAALGPAPLDLAALMSGRWSDDDRLAMTNAYCDGAKTAAREEITRGVTACRLLVAVQWLGWATEWTAPADHRNDWLEEAERCAEELRG